MAAPHHDLHHLVRTGELPDGAVVTSGHLESAVEHGVIGILWDHLRVNPGDTDQAVLTEAAQIDLLLTASLHRQRKVVSTCLDRLEGIGAVGLAKGMAIGARHYARPESRPSSDVDLFVDPARLDRFGDVYVAIGGDPTARGVLNEMGSSQRVFEESVDVDGVAVDLHRDIMNLLVPTRQADQVWSELVEVDIGVGRPVLTLGPTHELIHALINSGRDGFARLIHLSDIARMLDAEPDLDAVMRFCEAEGWVRLIRLTMAQVCDLLDRPDPFGSAGSGWVDDSLSKLVWPGTQFLSGRDSLASQARRQSALSLLIDQDRSRLVRAAGRRILPPAAVVDHRHPEGSGPYPLRLWQWRRSQSASRRQG